MSRQNFTAAAFLFTLLIAMSTAQAQDFKILTAVGSPAESRDGVVLATVPTAPFDGGANSLYDGVDKYYTVKDTDGTPIQISVGKNLALGTVRIAFDDGDNKSAVVDPAQSKVVVKPSTIPADSATTATVMVMPVDLSGAPLGAGLDLKLDTRALLPGVVEGAIEDNLDGTYEFRIISLDSGEGSIVVTVEGQKLDTRPTMTYEFVVLSDEQQYLLLKIDELQAAVDASPDALAAVELVKAAQHLQESVSALTATPPDRVDAIDKIKKTIDKIEKAIPLGLVAAVANGCMADLSNAARTLGDQVIADAIALGGDAAAIDEAMAALNQGDAHLMLAAPLEAAKAYKDAAKIAAETMTRSVDPIVTKTVEAVDELENAVDKGFDPVQAEGYMERIADNARQLALVAIDAAVAARGVPDSISTALGKRSKGDEQRALNDYKKAAGHYEEAALAADEAAPGQTYDVVSLSAPRSDLEQIVAELQAIVDAGPGGAIAVKLNKTIEDLQEAVDALP